MIGIFAAFFATILITRFGGKFLPRDGGREFAHEGKNSAGKPRGAGLIFICVFCICSILFLPLQLENVIYLILVLASMLTGYLDDRSEKDWGRILKGVLDLVIAVLAAITLINFQGTTIQILSLGIQWQVPKVLYGLLAVVLVWVSINVTNCADGVDGLSGTLALVTLAVLYIVDVRLGASSSFSNQILIFSVCILGYLWFNATPSKLMMGDAGSRAMGLFLALVLLKSTAPFLYIPAAFVLLVDGGLGLFKVSVIQVFHRKNFMSKIRTPLHDHVRKNWDWSNTQTVYRFAIIQAILGIYVIFLTF
jgi:phospho-N-acetylmuramoyl-pentapeptide-transferase